MGLFFTRKINSHIIVGIWEITESLTELIREAGLSVFESSELNKIKLESRKLQWLSIRALLKKILNDKPEIEYTPAGKPYLKNEALKISFSHTSKFVAVIINKKEETGIDIEQLTGKVENVKNKFLNEPELLSVSGENILEKLMVYWGAKEALYKLYGKKELLFKENIFIEPFVFSGKGMIKGEINKDDFKKTFLLHYEKIADFVLVYILEEINLHFKN